MNEVKNYLADLTVLFVDDEEGIREPFEALLGMWCKKAYSAANGKEGLEAYKKYKPDVIVTDIKMPVMSGLEMIGEIKKLNPDFPIIITTAFQESELLLEAIELQVDGYIVKPIPKKELKKRLEIIAKVSLLEKELEKKNLLNQLYLDCNKALMLALDINGNITMINKAGCEILCFDRAEIIGKNWFEIGVIPKENIDDVKTYFLELISDRGDETSSHFENKITSNKKTNLMFSWENTLLKENNKITGVLSSGMDITNRYILEEKLIEQTYTDELTGLYNRKSYNDRLQEFLALKKRYDITFSMLMYDIDDFKIVNDNYGHDNGDKVLIDMSALIESHIRENDYLFRIGGEEFIIIFSETSLDKAKVIAEKIRKKVSSTLFTSENLKITISIGLSEVLKEDDASTIFKRVDKLLYKSKHNGKDKISC